MQKLLTGDTRKKSTDVLVISVLCVVLIIVSFPPNSWYFSPGIDPPLKWVFNSLFEQGISSGKSIIFPHGPLAFFMYPLPGNILFVTIVVILLKVLLVIVVYDLLSDEQGKIKWTLMLLVPGILLMTAGFNHLVIANVLFLYLGNYLRKRELNRYIALLLTAFVFYIKAYAAILSGIMFFSFEVYCLFRTKKIRLLLTDTILLVALIIGCWLLMYGSVAGFTRYVWGMVHLALDNSSAVSLYPHNNWWLIILFFVFLVIIVSINRSKPFIFYYALVGALFYAAWKHGMSREDIFHYKGFIVLTIIVLTGIVIISRNKRVINSVLALLALVSLSLNWKNTVNFYRPEFNFDGPANAYNFIHRFGELKEESEERSEKEIAAKRLPQEWVEEIGESSVDVYPWDYSIVAANGLNWQPRVVIQSYASYTSWLDQRNALHFEGLNGPEFLIWEVSTIAGNINGGGFGSIDYRYLLNDEPKTLLQLIRNYKFYDSGKGYVLFKRREEPLNLEITSLGSVQSDWDKWIKVPQIEKGLVRAKLQFRKRLLQILKSIIYKDEQFWIHMRLENGLINKYRIVPENAEDGLWINPYILSEGEGCTVKEIRFICSDRRIIDGGLSVDWEVTEQGEGNGNIERFFNVQIKTRDTVLINSINGFEENTIEYWTSLREDQVSKSAYEGSVSHFINGEEYSCAFQLDLDRIPFGRIRVASDCQLYIPGYKMSRTINFVLGVSNAGGNVLWKGIPVDDQLVNRRNWNHIGNFIEYDHYEPGCKLSAYIWSKDDSQVFADNFRVMVFAAHE